MWKRCLQAALHTIPEGISKGQQERAPVHQQDRPFTPLESPELIMGGCLILSDCSMLALRLLMTGGSRCTVDWRPGMLS